MSYNWKHLIKNDRKTWSNSNSRLGEGKCFVSGEEEERRRKRRKIFGEVKYLEEEKIGKGKGGKYFLGTTSLSIILSQSQSNQVYETAVSQFVTDKGRLDLLDYNELNSGPIKIRCVQNNQPHSQEFGNQSHSRSLHIIVFCVCIYTTCCCFQV